MEYVSPEGLRFNGGRPTEMRQLRAEIGSVAKADGSAVFEVVNTKVIAAVYDSREVQNKSQQMIDQASKRVNKFMHLVYSDIFVQVLQADGGTRSACVNAATLAFADAGIPMRELVTSCSTGYLNRTPLLDLNYVEDSAGGADVSVAFYLHWTKLPFFRWSEINSLYNICFALLQFHLSIAEFLSAMPDPSPLGLAQIDPA